MGRWLSGTFWLVVLGLCAVAEAEFCTRPDSDGIEHQFDMTWGERFGVFFGTIAGLVFSFLVILGVFLAIGWIGSRAREFARCRWAERSDIRQPPAN